MNIRHAPWKVWICPECGEMTDDWTEWLCFDCDPEEGLERVQKWQCDECGEVHVMRDAAFYCEHDADTQAAHAVVVMSFRHTPMLPGMEAR